MRNDAAYMERHMRALTLFLEGERLHNVPVDEPKTASEKEYQRWVRYARSVVGGEEVSPFVVESTLNTKSYETPFMAYLGEIMHSPNKMAPDFLKSMFKRPWQPITHMEYGALRCYAVCLDPLNMVRAIRRAYQGAGEPVPVALEKIFWGEQGHKFYKTSLSDMIGEPSIAAVPIASLTARLAPHVVGSIADPATEMTRTASIWAVEGGRDLVCVSRDGTPYALHVPSHRASSNKEAVKVCEAEIVNVLAGQTHTLERAQTPLVQDLFLPATSQEVLTREIAHRYNLGRARIREVLKLDQAWHTVHTESVRDAVISLGKHGRGVINPEDGRLSGGYRTAQLWVAKRMDGAAQAVQGALDPDMMALLTAFDLKDPDVISWFAGAPDMRPHQNAARIRRDAEDAFMATGPMFFLASRPEIRNAVVEREPLLPLVRSITGLSKAQVNAISAMLSPAKPEEVVRDFPPFDPQVIRTLSLRSLSQGAVAYRVFKTASKQKSPAACAAEAAKLFDADVDMSDVRDTIRSLDDLCTLISVSVHGRQAERTINHLRARLYPQTMTRLIQITRNYHDGQLWTHERSGGYHYEVVAKWTPFQDPMSFENGYVVRELISTADVVRQGELQGHCVGSYARTVLAKQILLLSVEKDGAAMSTVEVQLPRNTMLGGIIPQNSSRLESVQHRARFNRDPDPVDEQLVADYLRVANQKRQERLPAYFAEMDEANANSIRVRSGSALHRFMGFSSILPPAIVREGYDALIADVIRHYELEPDVGPHAAPRQQEDMDEQDEYGMAF